MRILRVTRGFAPRTDGWSRHALRLSELQTAAGHTVRVVQPECEAWTSGLLTVDRIAGPVVNRSGGAGVLYFAAVAALAAARIQSTRHFDVVHVHGDALEIGAVALAPFRRTPLLATFHGTPSGHVHYRAALRAIAERCSGFIAVSPLIRERLIAVGVSPRRILVQSSGIDLAEFANLGAMRKRERSRLGLDPETFAILFLGRLEKAKGLEVLLESLPLMPRDVAVLIAGSGSLDNMLRTVGRRVHLLGNVPHARVPSLLAATDTLVLPSIASRSTSEGTPTAILEAFAARCPVIASRTGGIPPLLANGERGVLIDALPSELVRAVAAVRTTPALRKGVVERAHAYVQQHDWVIVARRMTDFTIEMMTSNAA